MNIRYFVVIILSFLVSGCYEGYVGQEGDLLKQYLAPEALKALIENPREDIWIIDVRPAAAYTKGHIPGAQSFPSSTIMTRLDLLPKDTSMIIYCETGGRAQRVIKKLEGVGYTRLMNWGGYKRWKWEFVSSSGVGPD